MEHSKTFCSVTLRRDAFLAVAKHLRGEQLTALEKEQCRIAHDAFVSAMVLPMVTT